MAQQNCDLDRQMNVNQALNSLTGPFLLKDWREAKVFENYNNPLGYYLYNYSLPEDIMSSCLLDCKIYKTLAYIEDGHPVAFYLAIQEGDGVVERITEDLGIKPIVLFQGFDDHEDIPYKWYWDNYKGFNVALHPMPGAPKLDFGLDTPFALLIITKHKLDDYIFK